MTFWGLGGGNYNVKHVTPRKLTPLKKKMCLPHIVTCVGG